MACEGFGVGVAEHCRRNAVRISHAEDFLIPEKVTPDGRLWLTYSGIDPTTSSGLLWWDGANIQTFPTHLGANTGLPYGYVDDLEIKTIANGYELWMSCLSHGIAVLTVESTNPTSVDNGNDGPALQLAQNSPNPFQSATRVSWSSPKAGHVRLTIFDVTGRAVRTLVNREMVGGSHEVTWDGARDDGGIVANGVYYYRLDTAGQSVERKMMVLR